MKVEQTNQTILFSLLISGILTACIGIRIYVMHEHGMDSFSGSIAFVISLLTLLSIYLILQSIIDYYILRLIPNSKEVKNKLLQDNIANDKNIYTTNYKWHKSTSQQKIIEEQEAVLQQVINYTNHELALYLSEMDLDKLCHHIRLFQYATVADCETIKETIFISNQLKTIDLMHFGWNIGNQLNKSGLEVATFISRIFHENLRDVEVSTLKRKLKSDGTCRIKIQESLRHYDA